MYYNIKMLHFMKILYKFWIQENGWLSYILSRDSQSAAEELHFKISSEK